MKEYVNVYDFKVYDEIRNGNEVFMIDKEMVGTPNAIRKVGQIPLEEFVEIIEVCDRDNNCGRYDFYKIVE